MTVFVSFAAADRAIAESLEAQLERRGQFVELDDGQTAQRPVMTGDACVLLVSQALVFAPTRLRIEQRALDAWVNGRLIIVKLDHGIAPVGLRDLPSIDASFAAQREFTWMKVADAVREAVRPRPAPAGDEPNPPLQAPRKRGDGWSALAWLLLAVPGIVAIAAAVSIWLVNRIGPTPGTLADLLAGVGDLGARIGLPAALAPWVFAASAAVTVLVFAGFVLSMVGRVTRHREAPAPTTTRAESAAPSDAMFVSYARANQGMVLPVIDAARQSGREFWVDQQGGISSGDSWAGEIVRAIRGAAGVVVMCSKAAFESDHVKREIYLADRYKKKLLPVFIEAGEPPEDFEYFFAGVQSLRLFETPEAERPQAFVRMLG